MKKFLSIAALGVVLSLIMHGTGELVKRYFYTPAAYLMICVTEPEADDWSCGTAEELLTTVEEVQK